MKIFSSSTILAVLLVLILSSSSASFSLAKFNTFPSYTNTQGQPFSDVSRQVNLGPNVPLRVSTLIDWSNSKNIDFIGIHEDNPSCIEARLWDGPSNTFATIVPLTEGCDPVKRADPTNNPLVNRFYVSAAAVDINRDGRLDLVATHNSLSGGGIDIIFQTASGALQTKENVIDFPSTAATGYSSKLLNGSSANIVNYFGDCALHDIVAVNDKNKAIVFRNMYTQAGAGGETCVNVDAWTPENANFTAVMSTLVDDVVPAGIASVDLDGDCGAEYLVARSNSTMNVTQFLKFPMASNDDNIKTPTELISVPSDFGAPTWHDWNGDGAIDVAFPVCVEKRPVPVSSFVMEEENGNNNDVDNTIDLLQNSGATTLVLHLVRCATPNNFTGVLVLQNQYPDKTCDGNDCCKGFASTFASIPHTNIPVTSLPSSAQLVSVFDSVTSLGGGRNSNNTNTNDNNNNNDYCFLSSGDPTMMPVKLRPGDLNDDMYADGIVQSTCGPLYLKYIKTAPGGLTFSATRFITAATTSVPYEDGPGDLALLSSEYALPFFFDLTDDGRLDVLIMRQLNFSNPACTNTNSDGTGTGGNRSACAKASGAGVFAFWHSEIQERTNYFITATTVNGATKLPDVAWGAIQIGATARFQHLDINNDVHASAGTQMPSSAYFELAAPRPHYGVGLTFASVMNFASGFILEGKTQAQSWPTVYLTPNSQILCVPHPVTDKSKWVLRLYLLGNWDLQLVLIAWLIALAVIGIPIVALGIREVHEDRKSFGL